MLPQKEETTLSLWFVVTVSTVEQPTGILHGPLRDARDHRKPVERKGRKGIAAGLRREKPDPLFNVCVHSSS